MGPVLEGAGLNITVMSYVDSVDIGFIAAPNLVPDLWDLADDVAPAFDELRSLLDPVIDLREDPPDPATTPPADDPTDHPTDDPTDRPSNRPAAEI